MPAAACKILVKYPTHLEPLNAEERSHYYVVAIERRREDHYLGKVRKSFGGPNRSGARALIRFATGEEAHAICPITLVPGQTYLLRSKSVANEIEVSRFNWLNVPSTHERFDGYVRDLVGAQ